MKRFSFLAVLPLLFPGIAGAQGSTRSLLPYCTAAALTTTACVPQRQGARAVVTNAASATVCTGTSSSVVTCEYDGSAWFAVSTDNSGTWTGVNGETLTNAVDGAFLFTRDEAGTVTLVVTDGSDPTALLIDTGTTGDMTLGTGMGSLTVSTDGTGTGEVVLPLQSIAGAEIVNDTIDGTELADTIALDATLGITSGAAEGIAMTHAMTNDTAEVAFNLAITASDTSPSTTGQYGLYIDNVASTEGLDAAIVIDNSDADDAVIAGILFVDAGGGFTNAIDTAGGNITTGAAHITAQMPVVSLASGALTLNTIHLATAGGADYDIPDGACNAAADIGNWVTVVLEDASVVVSITSDDASNIFTVPGLGALTAGDELDSVSHTVTEGQSITLTCLTAENWYFTGGVTMHTDATIAWADGSTAD